MGEPLETIIKDSIAYAKSRLSSESSFFGLLLYNCRQNQREIVKKCFSAFQRENQNASLISYHCSAHPNEFYESLCRKKSSKPKTIFFIIEPGSDLYKLQEIRKNCFSIDFLAFTK